MLWYVCANEYEYSQLMNDRTCAEATYLWEWAPLISGRGWLSLVPCSTVTLVQKHQQRCPELPLRWNKLMAATPTCSVYQPAVCVLFKAAPRGLWPLTQSTTRIIPSPPSWSVCKLFWILFRFEAQGRCFGVRWWRRTTAKVKLRRDDPEVEQSS